MALTVAQHVSQAFALLSLSGFDNRVLPIGECETEGCAFTVDIGRRRIRQPDAGEAVQVEIALRRCARSSFRHHADDRSQTNLGSERNSELQDDAAVCALEPPRVPALLTRAGVLQFLDQKTNRPADLLTGHTCDIASHVDVPAVAGLVPTACHSNRRQFAQHAGFIVC